jgi:hypothetical protein
VQVSTILYSLAEVSRAAGDLRRARSQLERVVAIDTKALGEKHPEVAADLEALASVLRELGETKGAEAAEARARSIAEGN